MDKKPNASSPVNRIVIVLGIVAIIGIIGYGVLLLCPFHWTIESFFFASGQECVVFPELKLTIFCGDGGTDEVFKRIDGYGYNGFTIGDFSGRGGYLKCDDIEIYSYKFQNGKTILQFFDGKGSAIVSRRGTRLTLPDGQEFTLDGKTPLWLRCKSDGTIVQLNELPEGFVQFFESPPPDPGYIEKVKSYPEAFR